MCIFGVFAMCRSFFIAFATAISLLTAPPAAAVGDLLVAPTRLVLDGSRGTEVILNNIGNQTATYRVSLEVRRMKADGTPEELTLAEANAAEKQAAAMISYAPRRITLAPNQPQAIRVGVRAPATLPDGEYRAHMLFRAIPDARPVTQTANANPNGLAISIQPIYGITIPVIVRKGKLQATTALSNPRIAQGNGRKELVFDISRQGNRSVYGNVKVFKQGQSKPLIETNGLAVYTELNTREAHLPIDDATAAALKSGPVTIQYQEDFEIGGRMLAEFKGNIGG
jgi:P pilus assembly chaperone PapD